MATVYTGLVDEPFDSEDRAEAAAKLTAAGFVITTDDAGWIAEYTAGKHHVRVEAVSGGWMVSSVQVAGSVEWVQAAEHCEVFAEATDLAVGMADTVNRQLRLIGSLAGPLLAELRRTS